MEFDFSLLCSLTRLQIGDDCFRNVKEVKLIGLKKLEMARIGKKSFHEA